MGKKGQAKQIVGKNNLSILTETELQTYIIFDGDHVIKRVRHRNRLSAEQQRDHVCPEAELALVLLKGE